MQTTKQGQQIMFSSQGELMYISLVCVECLHHLFCLHCAQCSYFVSLLYFFTILDHACSDGELSDSALNSLDLDMFLAQAAASQMVSLYYISL